MTKPEVVDWLLKNGFGCGDKRKIHFFRTYRETEFFIGNKGAITLPKRRVEEYVDIWKGSVWYSDTGEEGTFDECGLDYVHIDEKGWLILENVWELKPKEEIQMSIEETVLPVLPECTSIMREDGNGGKEV